MIVESHRFGIFSRNNALGGIEYANIGSNAAGIQIQRRIAKQAGIYVTKRSRSRDILLRNILCSCVYLGINTV